MPKKNKTPEIPKGQVDASNDLYWDITHSPPDPDEIVIQINPDGTVTEFPATELDPKDW